MLSFFCDIISLGDRMIKLLQTEMNRPTPYGWFHLMFIILSFILIFILFKIKNKYNKKQLKTVLAIYGVIAFILELLKQISWSYDIDKNIWNYTWYSAPFQLCTMPIYISLICLFLRKSKLRDSLLSFIAFYTILGSIATMIMPNSCFVKDILVNIHTMYLHCGSFVLSIYLLMNEIKPTKENIIGAFKVFIVCVLIALTLDISFYKLGIIGNSTFNMFYISPYFTSELPVFNIIQDNVPYICFLLSYIIILSLGSFIIYLISKLFYKKKKYNIVIMLTVC